MKFRSLIGLLIPLCALSGCSYNGEAKTLLDGDLLLRDKFEIRDDSFDVIDQHLKAKDSFCLYISLEGCSSCAKFLEGFQDVVMENKILTYHLEAPSKSDDIKKLYAAYPAFETNYSPSFFVINEGAVESIPYDQINSANRLRNTLRRKVTLTNHYLFESENVDFNSALTKLGINEATLVELDFKDQEQVTQYKTIKGSVEGTLFIHQKNGLTQLKTSKISK